MRLVACLAVVASVFLPGCWSYQSGSVGLPREVPETTWSAEGWPSRDLGPVRELAARTPEIVHQWVPAPGADLDSLSPKDRLALENAAVHVTYQGIHGQGLLRVLDVRGSILTPEDEEAAALRSYFGFLLTGFSPNAHWLTSRTIEGLREEIQRATSMVVAEASPVGLMIATDAANTPPGIMPNPGYADALLWMGMDIRFPPDARPGRPYRGVVLHLNAMFGNEYEVRTLDEFRRRGWAVIDLKPASQVRAPIPARWRESILDAEKKRLEIIGRICMDLCGAPLCVASTMQEYERLWRRFETHPMSGELTRVSRTITALRGGAFIVENDADAERVAREVAELLDQTQAGSAYAAEAVLDYVSKERPDLADLPVVLIGFSAGGLASPTTAARVLDRLTAAVIIGGGADCFTASQLSTFSSGGLTIRPTAADPTRRVRLPRDRVAAMSRVYLEHSKLDPYHTAPLLANIPVLVVHADSDTWVPAECGDLLWERLGRPDRLRISAGHELLFYLLPNKAKFIADWVERHLPATP